MNLHPKHSQKYIQQYPSNKNIKITYMNISTIPDYCGKDIVSYCKYQTLIKPLIQKETKTNTPFNQTQITKAMRYSQYVRK